MLAKEEFSVRPGNILVYAAGPYFTDADKSSMDNLKSITDLIDGIDVYYPFIHGYDYKVLMNKYAPVTAGKIIFAENIAMMDRCDLMLALLDGRDQGVSFEIGYANAKRIPILSFSNSGYGINLMLSCSVFGHLSTMDNMKDTLESIVSKFEFIRSRYAIDNDELLLRIESIKDMIPNLQDITAAM